MLLDRVDGKSGPPRRVMLEPLLKCRASTARFAPTGSGRPTP